MMGEFSQFWSQLLLFSPLTCVCLSIMVQIKDRKVKSLFSLDWSQNGQPEIFKLIEFQAIQHLSRRIPFEVDSSVAEAWCPACTTCGESSRRPPPGPDQGDPRQDHKLIALISRWQIWKAQKRNLLLDQIPGSARQHHDHGIVEPLLGKYSQHHRVSKGVVRTCKGAEWSVFN